MKEIVINFILNNIYIIGWAIIFIFYLLGLSDKQFFKYEQREENKINSINKSKVDKGFEKNFIRNTKVVEIIFWILYIITILLCVISTVTLYTNITSINTYFFNPFLYFLLYVIFSTLLVVVKSRLNRTKLLNYLLIVFGFCLIFPTYYKFCINQPYFYDGIVIFVTLFINYIFYKGKFKYISLLCLLGFNLIIFGQKFNNLEYKVIYDIMFALGTGLIVTAISNLFAYYEKTKKGKRERSYELELILFEINDFIEFLFYKFRRRIKVKEKSFDNIHYQEFVAELEKYLKRRKVNIFSLVCDEIIEYCNSFIRYCEKIGQNEKHLIFEEIFYQREIMEIDRLRVISKKINNDINTHNNESLKINIINFFNILHQIAMIVPEIEDLVNGFGKDKIYVEYEVGTLKMVWPNGEKVKANELFESKINEKERKEKY